MKNIPDSKSGEWSVESFSVSKEESKGTALRAMLHGGRGLVPEGEYKRLKRGGYIVMSNTPDELRDFSYFVHKASGSVLINGLGLGCVVFALLEKENITDITVIEKSKDVINLIAPYINDNRVKIINDDAFTYKPEKNKRFNAVWHDIWDGICADNLLEMEKLHRKYEHRTDWQDSWCKSECLRHK